MQRQHHQPDPRKRGAALLMILILVAATSVMCWAMLSEGSIRARATSAAVDALEAADHNRNAVNLAMYYLANPAESNEGASYGINGEYWAGGTYQIDGSSVTATVTPEPGDIFTIDVATTTDGVTRNDRKRVQRTKMWTATHALQTRDNARVPYSNWTVTGGIKTLGNLTFAGTGATYNDRVTAQNFASYPNGAPHGANPGPSTAPLPSQVPWLTATTYKYNGATYNIPYYSNDIQYATLGATLFNPLGVYRIQGGKKIAASTINGTIICRGRLFIDKDVTVRAAANMPAIVVEDELRLENDCRLGVLGVVYVGKHLHGSDDSSARIQGSLLIAEPLSNGVHDHWAGKMQAIHYPDAAKVRNLSSAGGETSTFEILD